MRFAPFYVIETTSVNNNLYDQLQGPATLVPATQLGSPYSNGCSALPQFVVNGVGGCSTPAAAQLSVNGNVPYAGFLVAGFNGFCTEEQLKEILGRCALLCRITSSALA